MTALAEDTAFHAARQQARLAGRRARLALPPRARRAAARLAARHALRLIRSRRLHRIALYLACGSELDTSTLIARLPRHLAVHVPVTGGAGRMRFVRLRPGTRLRRGAHGIRIPVAAGRGVDPRRLDLVLLPLSAWDARGQRLGAGGGYYDRALAPLARRARPLRIGYAFAAQRQSPWPAAHWDVPLHGILTERGLHRPRHHRLDEPT